MKELGITKGEWKVDDEYLRHKIEINNSTIHLYHTVVTFNWTMITYNEAKSNALLIADAGNTAQKCGLLPSELLKQRDELKRALVDLMEGVRYMPPLTAITGTLMKQYSNAEAAIKSTEQ
jgi:hypothetical protein